MPNLVSSFDLVPGVVVDLLGRPAVVITNRLDSDTEIATLTLDPGLGATIDLPVSWAASDHISVIGLAQDCDYDNISLFAS